MSVKANHVCRIFLAVLMVFLSVAAAPGRTTAEHAVSIGQLQRRGIEKGVIWQNGEAFLRKNTIRMNLALPFSLEREAFERLKQFVFV